MKTFQSIDDVAKELRKKDLERQISKEQLKLNYSEFKDQLSTSLLSTTAFSLLTKIGIGYLKRRIIK